MTKVQRYKVGFFSDEWGMSSITPCLIPDDSGFAVKFEDYCKLGTELAALKAETEALRKDAERYRWLRSRLDSKDISIIRMRNDPNPEFDDEVDTATDAAMAQGEKG